MMEHEITREAGARKRRKRVGRGEASGWGKTSGRGHKGYKQRSGGGPHALHEGGQMPIYRRMPKVGFSNVQFADVIETINLRDLNRFADGATVDLAALKAAGLIKGNGWVKLLATGKLEKKLTIEAHACSAAARAAVEKSGGTLQLLERRDPAALAKAKRFSAKKATTRRERVSRLAKKKAGKTAE